MDHVLTFGFLGGDKLQLTLAEKFVRSGHFVMSSYLEGEAVCPLIQNVGLNELFSSADAVFLPYYPSSDGQKLFAPFAREALPWSQLQTYSLRQLMICGENIGLPPFLQQLHRPFFYGEQADFRMARAKLTCEAVLHRAARLLSVSLFRCRCLIIGLSAEGEFLLHTLLSAGADVTLCEASLALRTKAELLGATAVSPEYLSETGIQQLIINTLPDFYCDDVTWRTVGEDAIVLDIARPRGIDLAVLQRNHIAYSVEKEAWQAFAPSTVAAAIYRTVMRKIQAQNLFEK